MTHAPRDPNAVARYHQRRAGLVDSLVLGFISVEEYEHRRFSLEWDCFGHAHAQGTLRDIRAEVANFRAGLTPDRSRNPIQLPIEEYRPVARLEAHDPDSDINRLRRLTLTSLPAFGIGWLIRDKRDQ